MDLEPNQVGVLVVVDYDIAVSNAIGQAGRWHGLATHVFTSGQEFLDSLDVLDFSMPTCVLLDLKMPGKDGLNVLASIRERGVSPKVVMFSGNARVRHVVQAMKLGTFTFLEKPLGLAEIFETVDAAIQAAKISLMDEGLTTDAIAGYKLLKPRELTMVDLLMLGKSNKEMAPLLKLSLRGVESRLAGIMRKMAAESRFQLGKLVEHARRVLKAERT